HVQVLLCETSRAPTHDKAPAIQMTNNSEVGIKRELQYFIEVLEGAAKIPARKRQIRIAPIFQAISEHAYQFGLAEHELYRLVRLITAKTELDQRSIINLIKHLYPSNRVDNGVIIYIINTLGQAKGSPPPSVQAALVRWVTAIYYILQEPAILSRFYGVLFNHLDVISLRPVLCQLLSVVTRRKHVRPFRIQRLLNLVHQTTSEPALISLLRVYKKFCPGITLKPKSIRMPLWIRTDMEWQQRLWVIQQKNQAIPRQSSQNDGFRILRYTLSGERKAAIPEVHTFHVVEDSRTLEEIHSASELVQCLEVIESPSQMVAALQNPALQRYLQLASPAESQFRFEFCLMGYFEEEVQRFREGFGPSTAFSELFAGLSGYMRSSKASLLVMERFFQVYLPLWNGQPDFRHILSMLSYLPLQSFPEPCKSILSVLQQDVLTSAEVPLEALLGFYTSLAQHWMSPKFSAHGGNTPRGLMNSSAVCNLIEHVSVLAESALAAALPAEAAIVSFYESIADLVTMQISEQKQILPPILPSKSLIYLLLSRSSLSQFSRLCDLLVTYKRCFEKQEVEVTRTYQPDATELLNGYFMDICNMLWRSRALNTSDANAKGLLCPDSVISSLQYYIPNVERDYSLHIIFDLSHNALIALMSQAAFLLLENGSQAGTTKERRLHAGPVTQRSLVVLEKEGGLALSWKKYRLEVLEWLKRHGINGMTQFLFATMKDLTK
ncbi:uncharacterized protein PV09_09840, partial [Verruconis gallopava]